MECSVPYDNELPSLTLYEWTDRNTYKSHTLNQDGSEVLIFPDDTLVRVATKIAVLLGKNTLPYIWQKQRSILFVVKDTPWKGYNVNPWMATSDVHMNSKPTMEYIYKQLLGDTNSLHVVFPESLPNSLRVNAHYFPNLNVRIPTLRAVVKEDDILKKLSTYTSTDHRKMMRETGNDCVFSRILFQGTPLAKVDNPHFLQDLFNNTPVDNFIPFMQWMDDQSRILYKVYAKHTIPSTMMKHWTSYDRLPKTDTGITMYSPLFSTGNRHMYARIFIDLSGEVVVTYHIDAKEKISLETIKQHQWKVFDHIARYTGISHTVSQDGISVRTEIIDNDLSLSAYASYISNMLPIFHVLKYQAGKIDVVFKRAKNYEDGIQLGEYIRSKLQMGIPVQEVVATLIELGIPESDITNHLQSANDAAQQVDAKKIEAGTLVHITKLRYGLKIHIENASSIEDTRRCLHWLRACVLRMKSMQPAEQPVLRQRSKTPSPLSSSSSPSPSKRQRSSSASTKSNRLAESIGSEELDFIDGGAIGKEHQRYFLNKLQEADPALFNDSESNYARMCQASAFHQPVVMSIEEKAKLLAEGYGDAIDNVIEYGSDDQHKHAYFCPRIWCPVSKIPLTYEKYVANNRKCPSGEDAKLLLSLIHI
jgi:hypothetical protein